MPDDDPAEDPEGESDDSANAPETGPSEEGDEDELTPEELADEVLDDLDDEETENPTEDPPDEPDEETESADDPSGDEPSPEELAEDVLQEDDPEDPADPEESDDADDESEEPSPEELAEEVLDESEEGDEDDELSPEELAEAALEEEETPGDEEQQEEPLPEEPEPEEPEEAEDEEDEPVAGADEDEPTPEELAEEVLDGPEEAPAESSPEDVAGEEVESAEEADEDEPTPEGMAEDALDEEDRDREPAEEPSDDVDAEREAGSEDEEEAGEDRPESPEPEDEPEATGVGDQDVEPEETESPSGEEEDEEDEDDSSIQSMLEEEAEKARDEELEDEEELPEGYLTVEQLPEEEEFEVPGWLIASGWYSLYALVALLSLWYLLLPLWETFLTNQIKSSMDRGEVSAAAEWAGWGTGIYGYLIKNDDAFRADYLDQLLEAEELDRFREEYEALSTLDPSPFVDQVHTEYLLNREEWSRALEEAERLQRWVRTRGQGYLLHGKAALELGQFEQVKVDANRSTQWIGEHPGTKRLLRDLHFRQGNYDEALQLANELENLVGGDPRWSMKVEDFVRMARINKELDRHRVAQRMLERALDRDPRNREALMDLAKQYLLEERWERSEPLVEGSSARRGYRSLYPLSAFGWWAGSELSRNEGESARSIRLIERAEDIEPRNAEVHRVKGRLFQYELEQPAQAVREYERARELGIRRLRFINELARARYQAGQYDGATDSYSTLREELGDTDPRLTYNLGSAHLGAGRYDRAEQLITEAFNEGYRNQNSYNQWGLLLELRGERQQALAKYVEGIEWGERNGEPIDRVRANLNRALAKEPPTPREEWLAPVQVDLGIQPWESLGDDPDTGVLAGASSS